MSSSCFDMISDKGGGRHGHHVCVRSMVGSLLLFSCNVVVPSKEAGDGSGQVQSVSSHKVRKDALHLLKPTRLDLNTSNNKLNKVASCSLANFLNRKFLKKLL